MTTTIEYVMCGRCGTEPATIHETEVEASYEVDEVLHRPLIKLPYAMCAACVGFHAADMVTAARVAEAASQWQKAYHRRLDEALSRQRYPAICGSCRNPQVRWADVSIDGEPTRPTCANCFYVAVRDKLLPGAIAGIEDGAERVQAMLGAMKTARATRDKLFDEIWGEYDKR